MAPLGVGFPPRPPPEAEVGGLQIPALVLCYLARRAVTQRALGSVLRLAANLRITVVILSFLS